MHRMFLYSTLQSLSHCVTHCTEIYGTIISRSFTFKDPLLASLFWVQIYSCQHLQSLVTTSHSKYNESHSLSWTLSVPVHLPVCISLLCYSSKKQNRSLVPKDFRLLKNISPPSVPVGKIKLNERMSGYCFRSYGGDVKGFYLPWLQCSNRINAIKPLVMLSFDGAFSESQPLK